MTAPSILEQLEHSRIYRPSQGPTSPSQSACLPATTNKPPPITIFEDNAACITQIGAGFIKTDNTKHVDPQIFTFTQQLISAGKIEIQKVESAHNLADFLTKALPAHTHRRLIQAAGMKLLHELLTN